MDKEMDSGSDDRLNEIFAFCKLIDKEKFVKRRAYLTDGRTFEDDAEHAWHLAVMVLLLSDYANAPVDVLKVMSILLVHDLVEIYAGDTYAYDTERQKSKKERESAAAIRLYSQLPSDLAVKFRNLWDEFEADETMEAHFSHTLDNIQPLLLHAANDGKAWKERDHRLSEILKRNRKTADGSEILWEYAKKHFIAPQLENGHLKTDCSLDL